MLQCSHKSTQLSLYDWVWVLINVFCVFYILIVKTLPSPGIILPSFRIFKFNVKSMHNAFSKECQMRIIWGGYLNQMPQSKLCMMGAHQASQIDPIDHNHRADNTPCQDIFSEPNENWSILVDAIHISHDSHNFSDLFLGDLVVWNTFLPIYWHSLVLSRQMVCLK